MRLYLTRFNAICTLVASLLLAACSRGLAISEDAFGSPSHDHAENPSERGWSGPWSGDAALASPVEMTVVSGSLPSPAGLDPPPSAGRVEGFSGLAFRGLAIGKELDWHAPEPWFIRIAVRRTVNDSRDTSTGVSLLFHDQLQRVLVVGCTSSGRMVIAQGGSITASDSPVNSPDQSYVWLIKFEAPNSQGRRVIRLRWFHESEQWPSEEPESWAISSEPLSSSATIDRLGIAAGSNVRAGIDELRIAHSWTELNAASR